MEELVMFGSILVLLIILIISLFCNYHNHKEIEMYRRMRFNHDKDKKWKDSMIKSLEEHIEILESRIN
jgi:hypothetical protein